jgi:hypothetical protein
MSDLHYRWIEVNLPFYIDFVDLGTNIPKYPNLNRKAKKQLGMTLDENEKTLLTNNEYVKEDTWFLGRIWEEFIKQDDIIKKKLDKKNLSDEDFKVERRKKLEVLAKKNKEIKVVLTFLDFRRKYEEWEEKQPEIIKHKEECKRIYTENKILSDKMSFTGQKLNKAGTLIEIEIDGKIQQHLIGHINQLCGVCNDCKAFDDKTIVKRYKVIWAPE